MSFVFSGEQSDYYHVPIKARASSRVAPKNETAAATASSSNSQPSVATNKRTLLPTPPSSGRPSLEDPETRDQHADAPMINAIRVFWEQDNDNHTSGFLTFSGVPDDICQVLDTSFPEARLGLTHDIQAHTLTIRQHPSSVHETISRGFNDFRRELNAWIQEHHEIARLCSGGSSRMTLDNGSKKEPDECFYVFHNKEEVTPEEAALVVEVGYSQDYKELRQDVNQWISETDYVQCVIIAWLVRPGDRKQEFSITEWKGMLEVYERTESNQVAQYGKTVQFLPPQPNPAPPTIQLHIRHLLPQSLINKEKAQTLELSLEELLRSSFDMLRITLSKRKRDTGHSGVDDTEEKEEEAGEGEGEGEGEDKKERKKEDKKGKGKEKAEPGSSKDTGRQKKKSKAYIAV
ncbi:hypothetical protein BJ138DRAFT_1106835 [Hygrophoropsis aurantiaca]|uniref:Uncharacterized protein n=1 Tax=Hygrophoropsis aurantiaca TaxID=72124 RepID=A0ACB7ZUM5_9AGAM|nr:hypothetical protein BJ138DRAFT_1106835 [Hygrophoropsis aurantiaca]